MPRWLAVRTLVVCLCLSSAPVALAQSPAPAGDDSGMVIERVRTTNRRIREALRQGQETAPTFRALIEELQQSDIMLYIEPGDCACAGARACLTFVTKAGAVRFLRATVSLRQIEKELIAHIGHELRHAAEIAAAGEIVDRPTLKRFYDRTTRLTCGQKCGYETEAAIAAQFAIRSELEIASPFRIATVR